MSRAVNGLYAALEPLHLYALHRDSMVDRELASYGAGLRPLEDLLEETLLSAFTQTASGKGLDRHEAMVGLLPRQDMDDPSRRELVLYRLGSAPFDFSPEGMLSSIRACGMEAEITQYPSEERIVVRCVDIIDKSLDFDRLQTVVRTVLPAHLDADFDIGELTWNMLESTGVSWSDWDFKGFSWTEFDLSGHEIFL